MVPTPLAVLPELEPLAHISPIFSRGVVPPLTLGTLKGDNLLHGLDLVKRLKLCLLHNFSDGSGSDGTSSFANGEAQPFLHRDRGDQCY